MSSVCGKKNENTFSIVLFVNLCPNWVSMQQAFVKMDIMGDTANAAAWPLPKVLVLNAGLRVDSLACTTLMEKEVLTE